MEDLKTKRKLKLDDEPAKLMSLDGIYAKAGGFPFQAMKIVGAESGKIHNIHMLEPSQYVCPICNKKCKPRNAQGYFSREDTCKTNGSGTHVYGFLRHDKKWLPMF